ncbi:hypothetical protein RB195_004790 [Necator americanus]|uniref:Secreted protein n=1 Tax=Necator americanus TaxID=51031 RepID=A0ABR1BJN5_NECAM
MCVRRCVHLLARVNLLPTSSVSSNGAQPIMETMCACSLHLCALVRVTRPSSRTHDVCVIAAAWTEEVNDRPSDGHAVVVVVAAVAAAAADATTHMISVCGWADGPAGGRAGGPIAVLALSPADTASWELGQTTSSTALHSLER